MAAKEISVKRYVVRLSADERAQLQALIRKGKSPAQRNRFRKTTGCDGLLGAKSPTRNSGGGS
jgi:hypothetical protein